MPEALPLQDKQSKASGFILERTAKRLKQHFQRELQQADTGITIDQWVLLQELGRREGLSQLELARAVFKDPPTVTRIIDLLCEKGLTQRVPDLDDRRRFRIQLTRSGRDKIEEVLPIVKNARRQAWKGLSNRDVDKLVQTLNTVFENLNEI